MFKNLAPAGFVFFKVNSSVDMVSINDYYNHMFNRMEER